MSPRPLVVGIARVAVEQGWALNRGWRRHHSGTSTELERCRRPRRSAWAVLASWRDLALLVSHLMRAGYADCRYIAFRHCRII